MGPGNAWARPQGHQSQTIKIKHLKKAVQQPAAGAGPMLAARPCFLRFFRIFSLDNRLAWHAAPDQPGPAQYWIPLPETARGDGPSRTEADLAFYWMDLPGDNNTLVILGM